MDTLYLLQFACFLFMFINILILGITRLHMKWMNRRYEVSRWLIIGAMVGLAIQFLMQMLLGFRAQDAAVGAVSTFWSIPLASRSSLLAFTISRQRMPTAGR